MAKLRVEARDDGVRVLTLTDAARRNAMGPAMAAELLAAVDALRADPDVRALVVTGEGSAFCAGADLPALFGQPDRPVDDIRDDLQAFYRAFLSLRDLPCVTIAAVNGPAVGAGLNLAMACRLRVAGTAAAFGATFARIGLHPGGGASWFLTRAIGPSRALRTLLLGDTIDAERAVAWGLADDGPTDDPLGVALDLAARMAAVDPRLARQITRAVDLAVETDDLGAVLEHEAWAQASSTTSPTVQAWVDRFR